jgi:hypothetical protein
MMGTRNRSVLIICLYVLGLALGGFLLLQHWFHLPLVLPYLVFLACPLMHLFMHRGHRHHRPGHSGESGQKLRTKQ